MHFSTVSKYCLGALITLSFSTTVLASVTLDHLTVTDNSCACVNGQASGSCTVVNNSDGKSQTSSCICEGGEPSCDLSWY